MWFHLADSNGTVKEKPTTVLVDANCEELVAHSKSNLSNGEGSIKSSALLIKPEKPENLSMKPNGPAVKAIEAQGSNGSSGSIETDDSINEEVGTPGVSLYKVIWLLVCFEFSVNEIWDFMVCRLSRKFVLAK